MEIENILDELLFYYDINKGVGHTKLIKDGVDNYSSRFFLFGKDLKCSKQINDGSHITNASVKTIGEGLLRGHTRPIVFDNSALAIIFAESSKKIKELELENIILKRKLLNLKQK